MSRKTAGIYIHVPFCKSKCPYCDFYSVIGRMSCLGEDFADRFTELLVKEIREKSFSIGSGTDNAVSDSDVRQESGMEFSNKEKPTECNDILIDTVYFGGGTPSLLEPEHYKRILDALKERYVFQNEAEGGVEITVECNPKTLSEEKLIGYHELGINRISLGAQSFDPEVLRSLGRIHREQDIEEAVRLSRKAGFGNISIDLMFGIPGQSMESWQESVKKTISLNPEHVSLYSLEFMEGTRFTRLLDEGKMTETEPELDRKMYEWALAEFENAGICQYEISNASKPGYESRHNSKYWKLDEYFAYGPSAHSFVQCGPAVQCETMGQSDVQNEFDDSCTIASESWGRRFVNAETLDEYAKNPLQMEMYEEVDRFSAESEFVFTGLRMNRGISKIEFRNRFGEELWDVFCESRREWDEFVREGLAEENETEMKLTVKGFDISNQILCLFV